MNRASRLPARVALRLGAVVFLVSAALAVWAARQDRLRGEAELRAQARAVASRLAVALQAPVYSFDGETVQAVAEAELAEADIGGVQVEAGELRGTWMRTPEGVRAVEGPPGRAPWVTASAEVMEPHTVPSARPLGTVTVYLSSEPLETRWREQALRRMLETLALVAALAFATWAVLNRTVVRPLERIRSAMVAARQGLADGAPETEARDPLAGLSGALPELRTMGDDYRSLTEAAQRSRSALAEREADLRATLRSIGDGVVTTDVLGRVLAMNPMAERILSVETATAVGRPAAEVFPTAPGGVAPAGLVAAVLARGVRISPPDPLALGEPGGRTRWVTVTAAPVRRQGGGLAGAVVVFRDVSEQRALEERVRQAQKLEAVGQLAGGVAHDFNNMLTPVLAYAQLILEDPAATPEIKESAAVVVETAARAAELTRQLLAFSRKGSRVRQPLRPSALLQDTAALLRRTVDRSIDIRVDARAEGSVDGDAALLQNAFLNLALNARDAMPKGGVLRLSTRDVVLAHEDCAVPGFDLVPGPHVEISVADTGVGIAPELLPRIFEPFFTTKEAGKGTGLGLAAVHGTAIEHGGAILVHSSPGVGTTCRLLLPVRDGRVAAGDPADRPPAGAPPSPRGAGSHGHALVVEDEPRIRALVVRLLSEAGFVPHEAADGDAGLEALRSIGPLALVVLDLVLPRRGGREVFEALRASQPGVPVLVTSGFVPDEALGRILAQPSTRFLEKPWRPSELVAAVEALCP